MRKLDVCDMEEFGRLESIENTIAILGYRWWPQTAKQDGDRISKQFLCSIWKKRNEAQMLEVSLNDRITYCEYGEAPTRQVHSNTRCCLWSGHTKKQTNSLALSSVSKKVGTRCRSLTLTSGSWKDAIQPSCDSPNTSRRFALGACNVGLVGENRTCSVPA